MNSRVLLAPLFLALMLVSARARADSPKLGPTDPVEIEAFFDGLFEAHRHAHHVVGATVTIVRDGKTIFAKGYGYADLDKRRKVDPERTLFRIGSVSKLFTYTAIMQLLEQGKLRLDADANEYLDFKIPSTYPSAITLKHLMTHTAGFEEQVIGLFSRRPESIEPLGKILARELPARVRPPGELASYSNHGIALLGYVVERLSGTSWETYVEQKILEPLGMKHTTAKQPVPEALAGDLATGYAYVSADHKAKEFEIIPIAPAGSMSASGADMARFMIAHLHDGALGDARILSEASAKAMRTRLFTHDSRMNGMLHGFYELDRNGEKIYGHGGDTLLFHSQLALFPERDLGIFLSYDSEGGAVARTQAFHAFLDHYFPRSDGPPPPVPSDFGKRASGIVGAYASIRASHTTFTKIAALFDTVSVRVGGDGVLVTTGLGRHVRRFREIEPDLYAEVDGGERIAFRRDAQGRGLFLFANGAPIYAYEKLTGTRAPAFHLLVVSLALFVFASTLVAFPIVAFVRRGTRTKGSPPRLARIVGTSTSFAWILFFVLFMIAMGDPTEVAFGIPRGVRIALTMPYVASMLGVGTAAYAVYAWKNAWWSTFERIAYSAIAFASFGMLAWVIHWNLLGARFH